MQHIVKGQSNWDKTVNDNLDELERSYTWTMTTDTGYKVTAFRSGTTVFYKIHSVATHQQISQYKPILPAGTIPVGFRPLDETFLDAHNTYGLVDGKEVGFGDGYASVLPDGSIGTQNYVFPATSVQNPGNGSWVIASGTAVTNDGFPQQ